MRWVALVLALSSVCFAGNDKKAHTGNEFLANCRFLESDNINERDAAQGMWCLGYFASLTDILWNESESGFCSPAGVTSTQLARVFLKYLGDHPEEGHKTSLVLYVEALRKAFPCQAK